MASTYTLMACMRTHTHTARTHAHTRERDRERTSLRKKRTINFGCNKGPKIKVPDELNQDTAWMGSLLLLLLLTIQKRKRWVLFNALPTVLKQILVALLFSGGNDWGCEFLDKSKIGRHIANSQKRCV